MISSKMNHESSEDIICFKLYKIWDGFENNETKYVNDMFSFLNKIKANTKFRIDETIEVSPKNYFSYSMKKSFNKKQAANELLRSFDILAKIGGIKYTKTKNSEGMYNITLG